MSTNQKPSVKKISEVTGFSTATVSNALNMKRGVNRETVERIFQAAEELGYSLSAKGLKSIKFVLFRGTGQIIDGSAFHPEVIEGVEQAAKENGLSTIFVRLDRDAPDYEEQVSKLAMDLSCGVILLATEMQKEDFERFLSFKTPLVLLDGWYDGMPFDGVLMNNRESAEMAVTYLIEHGHRHIGYIGGSFRIQNFKSRERGFRMALEEQGLECRPEWRILVGTSMESAFDGMLRWLEGEPELPTAFFADNDLIALGAIKALAQKGIRVPEDVSVVGFDNLPYSAISAPALTTIQVHKHSMGQMAVHHLLSVASGQQSCHCKLQCCTTFVERESVRTL